MLTRIVTCQGGIQLIAALAAISSRESEQKHAGDEYEYEDYLVVYDLFGPHGQLDEFARFVKKMALAVCNWKAIIYLGPEQMEELAASLDNCTPATVFARVHELVGITEAAEIYLSKNWQFGNRLLLNSYREAEKICYGDGIGIYFSEAYFLPAVGDDHPDLKSMARGKLRRLKNSLRDRVRPVPPPEVVKLASLTAVLPEVDFDIGYFLLPDILGETPPMETRLVRKESTHKIFRQLAGALDPDHIADKYGFISRGPTVVLMTTNFSEAAKMSREKEVVAYREFLKRLKFPRESTLVIKPHPRDSEEKINELGRALSDLFASVVLLTDPNLFFIPFEVFLMQTFRGETEKTIRDVKIVTFSTACLSLEVIFSLGPIIGFGSDIVRKFFHEQFVSGRIKHERDLQSALQKLAQVT